MAGFNGHKEQYTLIASLERGYFFSNSLSKPQVLAKKFGLGKNERLRSRKAIEHLFKEGKRFVVTPFRLYYVLKPAEGDPLLQFGVGVSAKNFKKAVDRNKIKRLTREAYRLQKNEIRLTNHQLLVFFIYTGKDIPQFQFIYEKLGIILKKLGKLINENNSSNP